MHFPKRARPLLSALFVAGLTHLGTAPAAHADATVVTLGVVLELTIAAPSNFGFGFDLRLAYMPDGTFDRQRDEEAKFGFGPFVQAIVGFNGPVGRVAAGLHAGSDQGGGLDFELGYVYRGSGPDGPGGHGMQLGGLISLGAPNLDVRVTVIDNGTALVPAAHIAGVARTGGVFGSEFSLSH